MRWLAAALLLCAMPAMAPAREPAELVRSPDAMTRESIRLAIEGDSEALLEIARARREYERELARAGTRIVTLGENVAVLSAAVRRPLPGRDEAKESLRGFSSDGETRVFAEMQERHELRERYRSARASRRYESLRRGVQTLVNAFGGIVQLQIFPLVQVPLDGIEYLTTGRHHLSPEQRRELHLARLLAAHPDVEAPRGADSLETSWGPRRVETVALQARRNAEIAAEQGRLAIADWWYVRELMVRGTPQPFRKQHTAVRRALADAARERARAVSVAPGGDEQGDLYAELLLAFLLDPAGERTLALSQQLRLERPGSPVAGEAMMVEALHDRARGRQALARLQFARVVNGAGGDWAARMARYLRRPAFGPELAFADARATVNRRKWDYVLSGADPTIQTRHLTAEEARLQEAVWITRARSLFVFDVLSRAFVFPFLQSATFPRHETLDTAKQVSPDYFDTEQGRKDLAVVAQAYRAEERYIDAAGAYERLGRDSAARKMREREAARLARVARDTAHPVERIRLYERILNGYPEYRRRAEVERLLEVARLDRDTFATIERKELRRNPAWWGEQGLGLEPELLDGNKRNGEIDADGLRLMAGNRVAWRDRADGRMVVREVEPDAVDRVVTQLYPRRRVGVLGEELARPGEILSIPFQVEGSAGPGFDVTPGLVPLNPDERERRLYQ